MRKKIYILVLLFLPIICCSCEKDPYIEEIIEIEKDNTIQDDSNESGQNGGDSGGSAIVSLLNFLGDSIIARWSSVSSYFPEYDCHNYGWSTKGIDTFLGRVNIQALEGTECVVEIGTNDMRRVIDGGGIDSYIEHYIDVLISLKAKRIYLLSLLPRNRAKDGGYDYNAHYPEINKKIENRVAARMDNVVYIPLYELFLKDGKINSQYSGDGLHPNARGYEVMAKRIREYLVK